jgi:helix-turn-helix protein
MSDVNMNMIEAPSIKQPIIENAVYEREEAIAITGFSLSTLIRAEKSGGLKGRHKGRRRYYLGIDLLKWLQEEHYALSKVERRQKNR